MKQQVDLHVYMVKWEWEDSSQLLVQSGLKMDDAEYRAFIKTISIEIDIPDAFDMRPQQIAALQKKKEKLQAETYVELTKIEEQIQTLLAIGYVAPTLRGKVDDEIPF